MKLSKPVKKYVTFARAHRSRPEPKTRPTREPNPAKPTLVSPPRKYSPIRTNPNTSVNPLPRSLRYQARSRNQRNFHKAYHPPVATTHSSQIVETVQYEPSPTLGRKPIPTKPAVPVQRRPTFKPIPTKPTTRHLALAPDTSLQHMRKNGTVRTAPSAFFGMRNELNTKNSTRWQLCYYLVEFWMFTSVSHSEKS